MSPFLIEASKWISIFALAFFSLTAAIPAGLALGLSPITVVFLTSLSYAAGAALVVFFGGGIRAWVMRRLNRSGSGGIDGRMRAIWDRFGIWGLGIAAPMTVGSQLGAAIGLILVAPPRRLFIALSVGGMLWIGIITAVWSLGILGVQSVTR